jgi:hypothetical protein
VLLKGGCRSIPATEPLIAPVNVGKCGIFQSDAISTVSGIAPGLSTTQPETVDPAGWRRGSCLLTYTALDIGNWETSTRCLERHSALSGSAIYSSVLVRLNTSTSWSGNDCGKGVVGCCGRAGPANNGYGTKHWGGRSGAWASGRRCGFPTTQRAV